MTRPASCPRCGAAVREPGLMSSEWTCDRDGPVLPLHVRPAVGAAQLRDAAASAHVPLWMPHPMPTGWLLSGLATAGDERSGARATAVALSGPCPIGGPADVVLVAEEPGVGLGARYAAAGAADGATGPASGPASGSASGSATAVDPSACVQGAPEGRVLAAGHPTALWRCPSASDRVALVGEALGVWLWMVLWPPSAELMLVEHMVLIDLRADPLETPLVGALTARLG